MNRSEYQKKWREKNKDRVVKNSKEYYLKHKEKIKQQNTDYAKKHIVDKRPWRRDYMKKYRSKNIISEKIQDFCSAKSKRKNITTNLNELHNLYNNFNIISNEDFLRIKQRFYGYNYRIKNKIQTKIHSFMQRGDGDMSKKFTKEQLMEKIGENPKCYLTGRPIDLSQTKNWHLDHIIPTAKGGPNTLENCNITCSEVNLAKRDMLFSEFVQMCRDVVNHIDGQK